MAAMAGDNQPLEERTSTQAWVNRTALPAESKQMLVWHNDEKTVNICVRVWQKIKNVS
jgi:aminoglycoside phosphotransferase (APT) family kinase protein